MELQTAVLAFGLPLQGHAGLSVQRHRFSFSPGRALTLILDLFTLTREHILAHYLTDGAKTEADGRAVKIVFLFVFCGITLYFAGLVR